MADDAPDRTGLFRVQLLANAPQGWRQCLAQRLHRLAERIDGRPSSAVAVTCDPPVPDAVVRRALNLGLEHAYELLRAEVREECIEGLMRRWAPSLYEVERRG